MPPFKAYMAYKETVGIETEELARAMHGVTAAGGMILVHAERGD